ncbi:MAG TPA: ABC transporter ATP-binding protein [Oligoflexia bacterium]|nr:ABC transporter ATP-binding protein [Oligoflexia bacterium]
MTEQEKAQERQEGERTEPIIEARNIIKSYRRGDERLVVLDNVSLALKSGEFLALMGPSGSGKSTLLNLIAAIDQPDSGVLTVAGQRFAALSERELARWRVRNVGIVFQFYNLIQVLNAEENVALPLALFSLERKERRERARFALEVVGLSHRICHFPKQLSGGEQQRVAIARAIVTDPRIIVADEPTGDLDRHSAAEVLGLLKSLNGDYHKTIVMVTHDPHAAEYASRIVHLDKGEISG